METVIRITIIYLVILGCLRLLGKRELSQLTPQELVTLMLIPEIVSQSMVGEDFSVTNGVIGVTTILSLVFLTSLLKQKSRRMEQLIEGKPSLLVERGRFLDDTLNKERISPDEVFGEMHKSGLERLEQVKWAILETDGKISIVPEDSETHAKGNRPDEKSPV
ncbi:MAG TPA: YetF domain-containing protein [Anaerolineales bacterium]|nr:YetF domain-containing protein [Anaerolineales bacterium]